MTLVKQGHESLSTSHVSFLTPFALGRGKVKKEGADDKPCIVATNTKPSCAREFNSVLVPSKIWAESKEGRKGGRKPRSRTHNSPSCLNLRWNRFLDPTSMPLGFGLDLELNLYIQYGGGGRNNNHLIVEITDLDHYQNLIKCSLASGWSLQ